jgi:hypothetical protein
MQQLMVTVVWNPTQYAFFQRGANLTAALAREKRSRHSQSGEVDKPVPEMEH